MIKIATEYIKKTMITRDSNNMALCKANSLSMAANMLACFDSNASCNKTIHIDSLKAPYIYITQEFRVWNYFSVSFFLD